MSVVDTSRNTAGQAPPGTPTNPPADTSAVAPKPDLVSLTIDGLEVSVPKGTLVIRAAEQLGIAIPRFCDHPLLDPVGACRQCMVEIPDAGNGRGFPKPQASCTIECSPGMKVNTQLTSTMARRAQEGMLELLLVNHPLDCPICDKGGECPLQNQALANGRGESRFGGAKRTFPKPVNVSAQILLDRERCVLCARCTRFSEQISGDPFLTLVERGALQQVGIYERHPYDSYFSGNVVQICPVGALTSADYRFQSRPFDLQSTETTCEHCASGCELRADHRHFQVKRRLAGNLPEVNEEWNCDKGRFAFLSGRQADRLTVPLVRRGDVLEPASWAEAIDAATAGLAAAGTRVGVLTGGRLLQESAYAFSRFARSVLGTNNVDCRARTISAEETAFLGARVAGRTLEESVTYADLEHASSVLLVSFEPEDESPIVFLRLRKAVRRHHVRVLTVGSHLSRGSRGLQATLIPALPGEEPLALEDLAADVLGADSIILVGERAAGVPGTLSAVTALANRSGARIAWIPRRAGEMGAIDAGCLPTLLPGGRPVADATARVDAASVWGDQPVPTTPGLDTDGMLVAAATGDLDALVVAGVQLGDLDDPRLARQALETVGFVVSFEQRLSEAAERADVVFPAPLVEEQVGTFVDWEHRVRPVARVNDRPGLAPMTETRILAALSDALGKDLGVRTTGQALAEYAEFGEWTSERVADPTVSPGEATPDRLRLDTWRELLGRSAALDGATHLQQTARPGVVKTSARTAADSGLTAGCLVRVQAGEYSVVAPLEIVDDMVDGACWLPASSAQLGVTLPASRAGAAVTLTAAVPTPAQTLPVTDDGGAR